MGYKEVIPWSVIINIKSFDMSLDTANTIELTGEEVSGWEHKVWLDEEGGIVRKAPNLFGKIWQIMQAEFAKRDIRIMQEAGIPLVPTEVYDGPMVSVAGEVRDDVAYVLEQPFCGSTHKMTYADLEHFKDRRDQFADIVRAGMDIRARHDLGLDVLGGRAAEFLPPALNPGVRAMPAEMGNLLVVDENIVAKKEWPDSGVKEGGLIASQGSVLHCDTRLYDWNRGKGMRDRILRRILIRVQDVQDTVLWAILRSFEGYKIEYDLEATRLRRIIQRLVEHAIPKMRRYAEMAA